MKTKFEMACEVISAHPTFNRKQMIELLVERVGLTPAGASTYYYNANKQSQIPKSETTIKEVKFSKRGSRTAVKQNLITHKRSHGDEPRAAGTQLELNTALNWYNYIYEPEQSKQWLVEYVAKTFPERESEFSRINITDFGYTAGWICRMLLNGVALDPNTVNWLHKKISSHVPESVSVEPTVRTSSDKIERFLPDFEEAVDKFLTENIEFSAYNYLTERAVPQIYASRIAEYYRPWAEELEASIKSTDPQLKEAYSHLTTTEKRAHIAFFKSILEDCNRYVNNTRKVRKPRKKRATSTASKFKHFRYMAKHDEHKIVSINPETIIGASQLVVLNTKNNVMTVFNAKEGGLNINRSSITNYDETTTKAKRVGRSLTTAVQTVLTGTKAMRNRVLDSVKTDFVTVIDRLNNDTVLLKVAK